ncbi:T9SS type A sorting domain-containing protein [bacterium]|nr:T9SS type A sorting domain-containing protein [bacterium]
MMLLPKKMLIWVCLILLPTICTGQSTSEVATQTIPLHKGWNLITLNVTPKQHHPLGMLVMAEVIDRNKKWVEETGCRVYTCWDNSSFYPMQLPANEEWDRRHAYYINMNKDYTWVIEGAPLTDFQKYWIRPASSWDLNRNCPGKPQYSWYFMGYPLRNDIPLASIPKDGVTISGDPSQYQFKGPFHDLIWQPDLMWGYRLNDLILIKTDDGRIYLPAARNDGKMIDQIGVLEPGRGYMLGFYNTHQDEIEDFKGWGNWYQAEGLPKVSKPEIPKPRHFGRVRPTHWSYPVVIDTIDQALCPMAEGDEVGIYSQTICSGAAVYQGHFPLVVPCWQKDIESSMLDFDGYAAGYPMQVVVYNKTMHREFALKTLITNSPRSDDPIAPRWQGFGAGFFAKRSFLDGILWVKPLPELLDAGQNHPNPFNSSTVIPLELPQRSRVVIDLFDVCGRLVWTHNAGVQNAGWPNIHFNASNLASGVYFYRVTATGLERGGNYQNIGKMLLLK